jgi:dipeptidyl aminopeptidase/acylaminoacyl peptidase
MRKLLILAALASVAMSAAAQQPAPAKLESAGALFGARASVQDMDISPDGSRVVYLSPGPGRMTEVYVADLVGGAQTFVVRSSGNPERLRWCKFVSNDRLICNLVGMVDDAGVLIPFSRLFAVDADGKNIKQLGQRGSYYDARIRQFDGDILDWLPDEDGAVLMAREYVPEAGKMGTNIVRRGDGMGVDRIDVRTMKVSKIEAAIKNADFFISDGRGAVRIKGFRPERGSTGQLASRLQYHYRRPGSNDWQEFSTWTEGEGMMPIEVDATTNSAYVLKKLNGRLALYRVKLDGSMATELVYKHDKVDVDGVVRIGRGARVIGVTFAEDQRRTIYFDPEYGKLATSLGKVIPKLPLVQFVSSSRDNDRLLIFAGSDTDPGRYFIYDKARRTLNETMVVRPSLENVKLANVRSITYPAGDGTMVPAYLTMPPGKEMAKNLPAVVLPHGGPSARDEWGFDWLAQFLAYKGYAVLQPNYRGSSGFGDAWLQDNGFKSWRTSIGDVTAAGRWLATQGIADPAKLGIVGWSYGGYAALQSGVLDPDLFKAVVAIAPVTDLDLVKSQAKDYTNASIVAEEIGSGPHIKEGSPLQNAERIKAPVLMFHGTMDLNVGIDHSRRMDARLRAAGGKSEVVVYDGLEHSLDDSNARAQMLDKISAFLDITFGR